MFGRLCVLLFLLPAFAAPVATAADARVVEWFLHADGSLGPEESAVAGRLPGSFSSAPVEQAFVLAPAAVVHVPDTLVMEPGARADLLVNGTIVGTGSRAGHLAAIGSGARAIVLSNGETLVPREAVVSLRVVGASERGLAGGLLTTLGLGSRVSDGAPRLVMRISDPPAPATPPPPPPAPAPTPNAPTPPNAPTGPAPTASPTTGGTIGAADEAIGRAGGAPGPSESTSAEGETASASPFAMGFMRGPIPAIAQRAWLPFAMLALACAAAVSVLKLGRR